ncbi:hypothetical protein GCM10022237_35900 [Nocardioides ginsengisoli]
MTREQEDVVVGETKGCELVRDLHPLSLGRATQTSYIADDRGTGAHGRGTKPSTVQGWEP